MHKAIAQLKSLSPYGQSRRMQTPRPPKMGFEEYEATYWRERMHTTDDGYVFIPPMSFKRSLETAAKYLKRRIPGKGKSEYGKHFLSGVLVTDGLKLPVKAEEVKPLVIPLSSRGRKGEADVLKWMPVIPQWQGKVTYYVLDDIITPEVFEEHLREEGNFIGIGWFRPEKGGYYGRYEILSVDWE